MYIGPSPNPLPRVPSFLDGQIFPTRPMEYSAPPLVNSIGGITPVPLGTNQPLMLSPEGQWKSSRQLLAEGQRANSQGESDSGERLQLLVEKLTEPIRAIFNEGKFKPTVQEVERQRQSNENAAIVVGLLSAQSRPVLLFLEGIISSDPPLLDVNVGLSETLISPSKLSRRILSRPNPFKMLGWAIRVNLDWRGLMDATREDALIEGIPGVQSSVPAIAK